MVGVVGEEAGAEGAKLAIVFLGLKSTRPWAGSAIYPTVRESERERDPLRNFVLGCAKEGGVASDNYYICIFIKGCPLKRRLLPLPSERASERERQRYMSAMEGSFLTIIIALPTPPPPRHSLAECSICG